MVNYPFIKIDVFSDVGFDQNNIAQIGCVTSYDELKTIINNLVTGKNAFASGEEILASLMLKVHFYNCITTICYSQESAGTYKVIFRGFADGTFVKEVTDFINE